MSDFTEDEIKNLVSNHNWELVKQDDNYYYLRQKDRHYMKTNYFQLADYKADRINKPPKSGDSEGLK